MNNNVIFLAFLVGVASLIAGCGDEDIVTSVTVEEQRELDSVSIAEYITEKGYDHSTLDTTEAGVIYTILDEGTGDSIDYGDIVNIYLSVKLADGSLLRTNIDTVAINQDLFDSTATYSHVVITHTKGGWALGPPESTFLEDELYGFIGMRQGMSAVLSHMKTGGRGQFITPSILSLQSALNNQVIFPVREVFVFDVYPTYVRK